MSKKITHEQMREHFKGTFNINDVKYEDIRLITNYITQQEKQEKLLELYRELNDKILHTYDIFGRMTNKEWKKFADIQQQIKELENEISNYKN